RHLLRGRAAGSLSHVPPGLREPALRDGGQGDCARDAQPPELVARLVEPPAGFAGDPYAGQPRRMEPDRDGRELGRWNRRHLQHLPLSLPPRLDRARHGRRLAPAQRRLPDQQPRDQGAAHAHRILPRGRRPVGLPAAVVGLVPDYFLIQIGVPSGASDFIFAAVWFETRTQPCETAWPSSCGRLVPWIPTTPPPGHSVSFE